MELIYEKVGYFSSDFNCNSLIYSTKEGEVVVNDHRFTPDHFKKDVKYYPPDDKVFTTTDASGLRVWDVSRRECIYGYRTEELYKHSYSSNCILSAFGPYNINFYDLRCRYPTHTLFKSRIQKLGWIGETLYFFDGYTMFVYDYKQQEERVLVDDVVDCAITSKSGFLLRKKNGQKVLTIIRDKNGSGIQDELSNGKNARENDILDKTSKYEYIFSVKYRDFIAGIEDKKIKLECFGRVIELSLLEDVVSFKNMYLSEEMGFLFMNDNLYKINIDAYEIVDG